MEVEVTPRETKIMRIWFGRTRLYECMEFHVRKDAKRRGLESEVFKTDLPRYPRVDYENVQYYAKWNHYNACRLWRRLVYETGVLTL